MISSGVLRSLRSGIVISGATIITITDAIKVRVMQHPIVFDR